VSRWPPGCTRRDWMIQYNPNVSFVHSCTGLTCKFPIQTAADTPSRSRGATRARSFARTLSPRKRGSRECRMHAAPAVSCANCTKENAHEHTGSAEALRHSLRNGFTAYAALSPATNSSCHRRRRIHGLVEPGWVRKNLRRLDTSNGCQDHTVLPYAATRLRQEASPGFGAVRPARRYRSRETRPAIPFAPDAAASTASHPNVSDDPDTPLAGDETAGFLPVIWGKREEEYFLGTSLTGQITLKALGNFLFRRNAVKRGQSTNLMPNIRPLRQTTSQGWRFG
jgi:hypothetical protein